MHTAGDHNALHAVVVRRPKQRAAAIDRPHPHLERIMSASNNGNSRQLEGKVALVTGASSGIGKASAIVLAQRGAKVIAAARRQSGLDEVVAAITAAGGEAKSIVVDVTKEADIAAMVKFAVDSYGKLDIAFNKPGTEGVFAPLIEQNSERFDMVFEPNVRGVFNSMKYEAEVMLKQGHGSIINNASM